MNPLLLALQFLTIIPVPFTLNTGAEQLGKSALFYPLVGLLIGCLLTLSALLFDDFSAPIQAALILIVWVLITGGLHLDGLADCADAWVGGFGSKQRSLAIMQDPTAGPMAVLVLLLLLLLKWSLLTSILEQQLIGSLLLIPYLGRASILILMTSSNYIRVGGLGEKIAANLPLTAVKNTIFLHTLIALLWLGVLPVSALFLLIFTIRHHANRRLGGMTGDVYGATVELVEVGVLLSIAI